MLNDPCEGVKESGIPVTDLFGDKIKKALTIMVLMGGFNRTYSPLLRQPKFHLLWQLQQLEFKLPKFKTCTLAYSYSLCLVPEYSYAGTL